VSERHAVERITLDLCFGRPHPGPVHALDVLGDPVRRRVLELLATAGPGTDELSAGEITAVVRSEFGISQPAVSQHLRVLRDNGFATTRTEGRRHLYRVAAEPLREAAEWFEPFRRFWEPRLAALGTEIARGQRARRTE
jgi:DNA-binding transcriptional ArsR family regulator